MAHPNNGHGPIRYTGGQARFREIRLRPPNRTSAVNGDLARNFLGAPPSVEASPEPRRGRFKKIKRIARDSLPPRAHQEIGEL